MIRRTKLSSDPDDVKSNASPTFCQISWILRLVFLGMPCLSRLVAAIMASSLDSSEGCSVGATSSQPASSLSIASTGSRSLRLTIDPCDDTPDPKVSAWYDGSCPLYDVPIEDSSSMHTSCARRFVKPSFSGSASCPLGNDADGM